MKCEENQGPYQLVPTQLSQLLDKCIDYSEPTRSLIVH